MRKTAEKEIDRKRAMVEKQRIKNKADKEETVMGRT